MNVHQPLDLALLDIGRDDEKSDNRSDEHQGKRDRAKPRDQGRTPAHLFLHRDRKYPGAYDKESYVVGDQQANPHRRLSQEACAAGRAGNVAPCLATCNVIRFVGPTRR